MILLTALPWLDTGAVTVGMQIDDVLCSRKEVNYRLVNCHFS